MRNKFFSPVPPELSSSDLEALAYAQLEEARLRIERLIADRCQQPREDTYLSETHRHLGLAAYQCSEDMSRGQRLAQLADAREHSEVDGPSGLLSAINAIVRAAETMDETLVTSLADHVQSAHHHLLAACRFFDQYVELRLSEQPVL